MKPSKDFTFPFDITTLSKEQLETLEWQLIEEKERRRLAEQKENITNTILEALSEAKWSGIKFDKDTVALIMDELIAVRKM